MVQTVTEPGRVRDEPPVGLWSRDYRPLTLGLILTVVGVAFEALAVATTLPATVEDLGGLWLYGWAFSAFMLTNLVGITVAGDEADRLGPARPFAAGVVFFVAGLLVAGLAPTMAVVIAGRALQGFGAGAIGAVAYAVVGRAYTEETRPRMVALLSTAWVVPGLIGPALAGLVAFQFGWRWVFLGLAPFTPLAALLTFPALRGIPQGEASPRDWSRISAAVRLAIGATAFMAGLAATATPLVAVLLIVAGVALLLPSLRQLLPAGTLLAARGLPAAIATLGLLNLTFFGADAFVPLAITAVREQSTIVAGYPLTAATLTWTAGAWLQARYVRRVGRRLLVIAGLGLIVAGTIGIAVGLLPGVSSLIFSIAWGIAGLGMGLAYSTLTLIVLEGAPQGQEGAASAAMQLLGGLGIAIGAGVGGVVIASASTDGAPAAAGIALQDGLMIGVAALAMLTALRLTESLHKHTTVAKHET